MNVKADFLEWFIKKGNYPKLGESTILKYIDGYVDFLGFDPFDVEDDLSNIEVIKQKILSRTEELKNNQEYNAFQYKSSRNAPAAFLGKNNYFIFLDELKNQPKKGLLDIKSILNQPQIQSIIQDPDFYFQKGQDALKKWVSQSVSDDLRKTLINLSNNYAALQEEADKNEDLKQILELLFEIISYCDRNAKDKNRLNKYEDKRTLAFAFVRMNNWIEKLIKYKFLPHEVGEGSPKNAFDYLLDPGNNTTMLSENHRRIFSENFLKKPYQSHEFVNNLKAYFKEYNLLTSNTLNYSYLLTSIVYSIREKWIENKQARNLSAFGKIIDRVKEIIELEPEIIGLFVVVKINKGYAWIGDKEGVIGNIIAHYELIHRRNEISVELHFEGKQHEQDRFRDKIKALPEKLTWFKWNKSKSISLIEKFNINNQDIAENLVEGLLYIEQNIGDKIREIMKDMKISQDAKNNSSPLNQILFGPPGTGKTYNAINTALELIDENLEGKTRLEIKNLFDQKVSEGQIVFTTFHQSLSYEDFVEGIKPDTTSQGEVIYVIRPGIFKKICNTAQTPNASDFDLAYNKLKTDLIDNEKITLKTPTGKEFDISLNSNENLTLYTGIKKNKQGVLTKENIQRQINGEKRFEGWEGYFSGVLNYLVSQYSYAANEIKSKKYVLIIDEINRGNVSQIFGELITLIEDDKRQGREESLKVILPYSKEYFSVPSNLYILGTMNTADRSVEAIDTALRRRFSFEEMPPKYDLEELQYELAGVKGFEILQTLNKRIEKLLDKDHQIGHSYFMRKDGIDAKQMLLKSFYKNIIPLLQEYFFGDFGKIGLVLGQGFVQKKEWNKNSDTFAEFKYESASEFDDRHVYEIIDHRNNNQADDSFINAIKTLMNKKIE